jgi:hypothetical protein
VCCVLVFTCSFTTHITVHVTIIAPVHNSTWWRSGNQSSRKQTTWPVLMVSTAQARWARHELAASLASSVSSTQVMTFANWHDVVLPVSDRCASMPHRIRPAAPTSTRTPLRSRRALLGHCCCLSTRTLTSLMAAPEDLEEAWQEDGEEWEMVEVQQREGRRS